MRRTKTLLLTLLVAAAALPAGAQEDTMPATFRVTSPAFPQGQPIPARFTADGADISPELHLLDTPPGTASFALVMDDPDAPVGTWVHWVVWNLPAATAKIPEGSLPAGAVEGRTSWGRAGYGGPAPPSGTHRYFFKVYALDTILDLPSSTDAKGLERAVQGHVLARAELMGTYTRGR
jgi:Raf kinase inhibitor-like YbhB/YbcL family protein